MSEDQFRPLVHSLARHVTAEEISKIAGGEAPTVYVKKNAEWQSEGTAYSNGDPNTTDLVWK